MKSFLRKNLRKITFGLIFIFLLVICLLFLRSEFFLVKNIIITTDFDFSRNSELVKTLEKIKGQNIFLVNEKELTTKIMMSEVKIGNVLVKKEFPEKILVNIKKREPLVAISAMDFFFLVDKEGLIFDKTKIPSGLPIVDLGLQSLEVGSRIEKGKSSVLLVFERLKGEEEIKSGKISGSEFYLELGGGTTVIFLLDSDLSGKSQALQMILNRFRIEGKRPTRIDLRFEKPIVVY